MTIDALLAARAPAIIAILRGVDPDEVIAIGTAIVAAGIRFIEVPLNSPRPLESIARLRDAIGDRALVGAGTVLATAEVDAVAAVGGRLIVSPNTNPGVIARSLELGLQPVPGFLSPSEAMTALAAGACDLKLFPARSLGDTHLQALREVLPAGVRIWAVGGVEATNLGTWLRRGASGVGVGGGLFRPGMSPAQVAVRAHALVDAWGAAQPGAAPR